MAELTNFQKIYLLIYYMRTKGKMPNFNGYLNEIYTPDNISMMVDALIPAKLHETKTTKSSIAKQKIHDRLTNIMTNYTDTLINKKIEFLPKTPEVMLANHYHHKIDKLIRSHKTHNYITPFETRNDINGVGCSIFTTDELEDIEFINKEMIDEARNDTKHKLSAVNIENYTESCRTRYIFTFRTNTTSEGATISIIIRHKNELYDRFLKEVLYPLIGENQEKISLDKNKGKIVLKKSTFEKIIPYFVFFCTKDIKTDITEDSTASKGHTKDSEDGDDSQTNSFIDIVANNNKVDEFVFKDSEDIAINDNTTARNNIKLLIAKLLDPSIQIDVKSSENKVFDVNKALFKSILNASPIEIENLKKNILSREDNSTTNPVNSFIEGNKELQRDTNKRKERICYLAKNFNKLMDWEKDCIQILYKYPVNKLSKTAKNYTDNTYDDLMKIKRGIESESFFNMSPEQIEELIQILDKPSINGVIDNDYVHAATCACKIQYMVSHITNEEICDVFIFRDKSLREITNIYKDISWEKLTNKEDIHNFEMFFRPLLNNYGYVAQLDSNKWVHRQRRMSEPEEQLKDFNRNDIKTVTPDDIVNSICEYMNALYPSYAKMEILDNILKMIERHTNKNTKLQCYPIIDDNEFDAILKNVSMATSVYTGIDIIYPAFIKSAINYFNQYISKREEEILTYVNALNVDIQELRGWLTENAADMTTTFGKCIPVESVINEIDNIFEFNDIEIDESTVVTNDELEQYKNAFILIYNIVLLKKDLNIKPCDNIYLSDIMGKTSDEVVSMLMDSLVEIANKISQLKGKTYEPGNKILGDKINDIREILKEYNPDEQVCKKHRSLVVDNIDMLYEFDFSSITIFIRSSGDYKEEYGNNIQITDTLAQRINQAKGQAKYSTYAKNNRYNQNKYRKRKGIENNGQLSIFND